MKEVQTYELSVCGWNGNPRHCVYLNNHRVAGTKPWGGAHEQRDWEVTLSELEAAIPALGQVRAAATALVERDCRYDGPNIIIPCADHSEALRLMNAIRSALGAMCAERLPDSRETPNPLNPGDRRG